MPKLSKVVSVILSGVFVLAPLFVYLERQNLYDWWRLRNYDVPAEVASLAVDTTMDPLARKIFYVAHPKLEERAAFQASCTTFEKTIVLGCYRSGIGIFVYDVNDVRLSGVLQVTSAHEMLHAAYERLSTKERQRIDKLTAAALDTLTDERVKKNIEAYRSRDPSVVPNELHSILGTEVRSLSPELETYYKKYFSSRSKIVDYSDQYEAEFTKREDAVAAYDVQLKDLKTTIAALNASLESQGVALQDDEKHLQSLLDAHKVNEYNAGIPAYQRLVAAYNSDVKTLKAAITTYNDIVDKRNNIVTEEQELINAIDSSVPATK